MPAHDEAGIELRPVVAGDFLRLFEWQTEPGARAFMRSPAAPIWEEHVGWCYQRLAKNEGLFAVIVKDGNDVGVIRCDPVSERQFEISLLIGTAHRGKGIGADALRAARARLPGVSFIAEIHPENIQSRNSFRAAGFREYSPNRFELRPTREV